MQKLGIWHKATDKLPELTGEWFVVRYDGTLHLGKYFGSFPYEDSRHFWMPSLYNDLYEDEFKHIEWQEQTEGIVLTPQRYKAFEDCISELKLMVDELASDDPVFLSSYKKQLLEQSVLALTKLNHKESNAENFVVLDQGRYDELLDYERTLQIILAAP